jgi:hypothetical protein
VEQQTIVAHGATLVITHKFSVLVLAN